MQSFSHSELRKLGVTIEMRTRGACSGEQKVSNGFFLMRAKSVEPAQVFPFPSYSCCD
jgi:hypothetical protein